MPSIVKIETPKGPIEWSVADQKMGVLVGFLDAIGYRDNKEPKKCPKCTSPYWNLPRGQKRGRKGVKK